MLNEFSKEQHSQVGIHDSSVIDKSASIGTDTYIGPNVHIGKDSIIGNGVKIYANCSIGNNVRIGDNTIVYSVVNVNSFCEIGNECIIQSGATIACDGFGFAQNNDNEYNKVAQIGNVIIEDNVEIGANTTIDRAVFDSTIISKNSYIDNLVQIAHNVIIGEEGIIAAQTGIAGSTKIGHNVVIGGQAGIAGHLVIGNNVQIAAKSGVTKNISDNSVVAGFPAVDIKRWKITNIKLNKL